MRAISYQLVAAVLLSALCRVTSAAVIALAQTQSTPTPSANDVDLTDYPNYPTAFPGTDQSVFIPDSLLKAPLVIEGLKLVQATVPANIFSIKPSTYSDETPTNPAYNDDPVANCYWPATQCLSADDISKCPPGIWGLSFDDGPTVDQNYGTQQVRDTIEKHNMVATFFAAGANVIQHPAELRTSYLKGHEIAVHTWTHHPLTSLSNEQIVAELLYTQAAIFGATGVVARFYRPPYGDVDNRVRAIAKALGLVNVMWTRDSNDAGFTGSEDTVVNAIVSWASDTSGFISLQHDITPVTSRLGIEAFSKLPATLPMKVMAVGQCTGQQPYTKIKTPEEEPVPEPIPEPTEPTQSMPNSLPEPGGQPQNSGHTVSKSFVVLAAGLVTALWV
ncbi:hypothetical protein BC832DRAFT_327936 [Gaertneriomyces semiglobifer]|nr:hypothetical protein BC832DRAFT_327936 [Gaertneriomyces semiglobifer]